MAKDIESPRISVSQFKGGVCVGCGRDKSEIKAWHGMKRKEKIMTARRARERLKKVGVK
ncbi:putative Fe-S protein YdhL (DUF1289 family) [Natronocella acetinitrilica]|uniref:Fe-S protein YdhL (DUF1289 family) n=1 Tax=Natronocella acetinitrilica TaxID=414046 RepID=A0AAE3G1X6_9GAMM|nr:DUF1289 domain-containing protein [Natronocella acetinitrilica]MCP1672943.1 putative Fe-S protein YdhL (DUF1289 family) [Natronocella acetinitrilica]